jgi:hypothetical protein
MTPFSFLLGSNYLRNPKNLASADMMSPILVGVGFVEARQLISQTGGGGGSFRFP